MEQIPFRLLEVDLTNETSRVINVTEDVKKYLGGKGLGNKLIWDMVPQGADPLGPDNILHVGIGPLTGLMGSKTILSFVSPLTGWSARSAVSGYFGEEIMKAQYTKSLVMAILGKHSHTNSSLQ